MPGRPTDSRAFNFCTFASDRCEIVAEVKRTDPV